MVFILLDFCISLNVFSFCFGILSWNFRVDSAVSILFSLNDLNASSPFALACNRSSHIDSVAADPVERLSLRGLCKRKD